MYHFSAANLIRTNHRGEHGMHHPRGSSSQLSQQPKWSDRM